MKIPRLSLVLAIAACLPPLCLADSGVIIPSGKQAPDPSLLAIESMQIHVVIDNGHATIQMREVFHNKTSQVLEGSYSLLVPAGAAISDFAVWDDLTRIPGVILERKRASELYQQIRNQTLDPGLLESGEVSDSESPGEARHSSEFSVKIVPIPAYGYKRVEVEYRQNIPVSQLSAGLLIPLKPVTFSPQVVGKFSIDVELRSPLALKDFRLTGQKFPLNISSQDARLIKGSFEAENFTLNEDFSLTYGIEDNRALAVQSYRAADAEPGFFEASAILPSAAKPAPGTPRSVTVLFDTSLSMQWEKLERSFQALEATLRSLQPSDTFTVIVFNSDVRSSSATLIPASTESVANALNFVRDSPLRGGTNLQAALASAFSLSRQNNYIVLLTDGELTEGVISANRFGDWVDKSWNAIAASRRPHLYALAIGDDANSRLLRRVAGHSGVFEQVGSAESLDFKLTSFINKIGLNQLQRVSLTAKPEANIAMLYRLGQDDFPGSLASWVGQYKQPGVADFAVSMTGGGELSSRTSQATLPKLDITHAYLPATWARARVDALLEKIDREGEDKASIDEIIALSRKYKFVTPYTSFLAAPRALLRPRLIRPGDPLLRVRTDPSIESLVALFPFGVVQPLRFIKDENVWQTRFVAPDDMQDGPHTVRLILRDRSGHVYREEKTFVVSSQAPVVRVRLAANRVRAGEQVALNVEASQTTRTITARLYGAAPVVLRWDEKSKANTGVLSVPSSLPAGRYSVHVTAEDMAHNVSHQEVPLEILP
jgi:Ca-activated chloride channel family protein